MDKLDRLPAIWPLTVQGLCCRALDITHSCGRRVR